MPLRPEQFDNAYARLPPAFYAQVAPTPLPDPVLVAVSTDAAALLDLDAAALNSEDFLHLLAGTRVPEGSTPLAALYAGHQFGQYVSQLGDGRAIVLGEVINSRGERWDVQLKGAGQTAFSRFGDGRAVLRSTIREFLCSEAMHALGIPTTRAVAIAGSTEPVYRETRETAAVLLRIAPSHVRFGSFEVFYYRREHEYLRTLADHVIEQHFPEIEPGPERYQRLLETAIARTARLLAQWQAVGFCHGVMNTDNMSILGLTLDYGPYGFMERFRYGHICNHSDEGGRYSYANQPHIGLWNLTCLAQALTPLVSADACNEALAQYEPQYVAHYAELMRRKLGLTTTQEDDRQLILDFLVLLEEQSADYTLAFRKLTDTLDDPHAACFTDLFADATATHAWLARYHTRIAAEHQSPQERRAAMNAVNPAYVLRNHLAQQAIEHAQQGDYREITRLLDLLRTPYTEQPGMEAYAAPPPPGTEEVAVSCSS